MCNLEKNTGRLDLSKNLDQTKHLLFSALAHVSEAQGQKIDRVQELCKLVGISKQTLAKAIIFETKGNISCVELAQKLNIHESTLRKRNWHDVRSLLVNKY